MTLDLTLADRNREYPLDGAASSSAAAGCLLLQALRTQITMSGFPEEYRTLVTGIVILIFAAAALVRRNERA